MPATVSPGEPARARATGPGNAPPLGGPSGLAPAMSVLMAIAGGVLFLVAVTAEPGTENYRNRWFGLGGAALFGLPGALGVVRAIAGALRFARVERWLVPLVYGAFYLVFGAMFVALGLTRRDEFVADVAWLTPGANRQLGGWLFATEVALVVVVGLLWLSSFVGRWAGRFRPSRP